MIQPVRRICAAQSFIAAPNRWEFFLSCGHKVVVSLPTIRNGEFLVPSTHACARCPQVPAARRLSYIEGGKVPHLRMVG